VFLATWKDIPVTNEVQNQMQIPNLTSGKYNTKTMLFKTYVFILEYDFMSSGFDLRCRHKRMRNTQFRCRIYLIDVKEARRWGQYIEMDSH
jgi:hypothetical protein